MSVSTAVNEDRIAKLVRRLGKGPAWRRRWAARRLAATASPEAVGALAGAAASTSDGRVVVIAHRAFAELADQEMIDTVCAVWRDTRDAALGELLKKQGWLAAKPPELRVLTTLHCQRRDVLSHADPDHARALAVAADDEQPPLRDRAREALTALCREDARDAVCHLGIEGGNPAALDAALAGGFVPGDPACRAALLFLAGEFDRYAELDFDGALLRSAHARVHERTRTRLAQHARASGRVEWIRVVLGDQPGELTEGEWEAACGALVTEERWEELWHLAVQAPARWSARMLRELGRRGWLPAPGPDRAGCADLIALAEACPAEIPPGTVFDPGEFFPDPARGRYLALSGDGRLLAWAKGGQYRARDDEVQVWHLPSGTRIARLTDLAGPIFRLALSPDGKHLALGSNDYAELRRLPSGTPVTRLQDHPRSEAHMAMTADGRLLATANGRLVAPANRLFSEVRLWDVPSGTRVGTVDTTDDVHCLAMAPDGSMLATGHRDGIVHLWELPSGRPAGTIHTGRRYDVLRLAMTEDAAMLATDNVTDPVDLWWLPSGQPVDIPGRPADDECLLGLAGTAKAGLLLGGKAGMRRLPSGKVARTPPPELYPGGLAVTPDGSVLATSVHVDYRDKGVRLWRSALHALCRTPIGRVDPAEIERCREADGDQPAERAWLDLISALVRWRHRHDIEVDAARESPDATDIELGG